MSGNTLTIEVTPQDLDEAIKEWKRSLGGNSTDYCNCCVVAQALRRNTGDDRWRFNGSVATTDMDYSWERRGDSSSRVLARDFDNRFFDDILTRLPITITFGPVIFPNPPLR